MCPIYLWNDIIYLPNEHFCYIPLTNIRGFLWIFLNIYGIPVISLSLIYFRITIFIRKHSINQTIIIKRRQDRDLNAFRRILMIVGILFVLGLPTISLILMMFITGKEHPLSFRVMSISIGTSMAGLSVALVFSVIQLKNIVWKPLTSSKVMPINGTLTVSIPMKANVTTLLYQHSSLL
ncbi:unnamed protein product [Rotaria sp. Silwood2]|nr:unnamed protein product [Rotaria sp. Silwood2]CAF3021919.1 unnamed protein product [Rotaria sp. Silwood2]CAF3343088.1 unnamed protein product [Rotaria sp. Silwood2]CAF4179672.1 unnamed protein product [Rotaria sp. Silwood2]CAF4334018.1 unnamed protein product [Rotaria sp. Silwood2]